MQIKEWGEESFIDYLSKTFSSSSSVLGIGDDCAVIPENQDKAWLVTTDALVEGVHFLKDQISARDLGYKTVAVNVSDIAAMGGVPKYAFLSIALPKSTEQRWLHDMMEGIKEACNQWDINVLGGDTVGSKGALFLNLTLIGTAHPTKIRYRSTAQEGDIICVNRCLGDSAGGLKALQENVLDSPEVARLVKAHFHPEIFLEQGIWLASQDTVHAMMDLSDGLDCDLKRLIKSSQKGALIETTHIPLSKELLKICYDRYWDSMNLALFGGEDYSLLFTVSFDAFTELQHNFQNEFQMPLHAIGCITSQSTVLNYETNGQRTQIEQKFFDHFQ